MGFGADRAIRERQRHEAKHEALVASNLDQTKVEHKAHWENKCTSLHRANAIKRKVADVMRARADSLMERRKKLGQLLAMEQKQYEKETVESEETPQERLQKTAKRAIELKMKRENERQRVVQEKKYQQWREGVDELRQADSQLFCYEVLAARDGQAYEKSLRKDVQAVEDEHWNKLEQASYLAKLEREKKEEDLTRKRNQEMGKVLEFQVGMKQREQDEERAKVLLEEDEMKRLWAEQRIEANEEVQRNSVMAKLERKKVDEYAALQKAIREEAAAKEIEMDKNFVMQSIAESKKASADEAAARQKQKEDSIAYAQQIKMEMAKRSSEEGAEETKLLQDSEKQWEKRQIQWDKEAAARQRLMAETYEGRAEQVYLKEVDRQRAREEVGDIRSRVDAEAERLAKLEEDRVRGEELVKKGHQEELFRQMDFHQVQRMREMQQHKIEQRDGAIQEHKFQRAINQEKQKLTNLTGNIFQTRIDRAKEREMKDATRQQRSVAPWDK